MEYDADTHPVQRSTWHRGMDEVTFGNFTIDRCTECQGSWFATLPDKLRDLITGKHPDWARLISR